MYVAIYMVRSFQSRPLNRYCKKKKPADWKKLYPNKKKHVTTFNTLDAARKRKHSNEVLVKEIFHIW